MGYDVYYTGEICVSPPLTEADAAIVTAVLNGRELDAAAVFQSIELACPKPDLPWCTGLLTVSEDRSKLLPEEDDSRHGLVVWLRVVRDHFLDPSGYVLDGSIDFEGEDTEDHGTIFVKDSVIEVVDDVIFNPGPSWEPRHYASPSLKLAVQDLFDSSDDSGFSSDFVVVAAPPVRTLRHLLSMV